MSTLDSSGSSRAVLKKWIPRAGTKDGAIDDIDGAVAIMATE